MLGENVLSYNIVARRHPGQQVRAAQKCFEHLLSSSSFFGVFVLKLRQLFFQLALYRPSRTFRQSLDHLFSFVRVFRDRYAAAARGSDKETA
jgi:hypothetical protein